MMKERKHALIKYRMLVIEARLSPELPASRRKMIAAMKLNEKWAFSDEEKKGLP